MNMSKLYILYFFGFSCIFVLTSQEKILHTDLIGHEKYMQDVMQLLIYDLEEEGLSKLRMKDFDMKINETLYGFEVIGDLHYFNGFVISIEGASIKYNSIMSGLNNTNKVGYVKCNIQIDEIKIAYDLIANLTDTHHTASGTYLVKNMEWEANVTKNFETEEIIVGFAWKSKGNDQTRKIIFLPKNDYTAVFSREFTTLIPEVEQSLFSWEKTNFIPLLEKIAKEKIPFPKLSYETHLDGI